MKRTPRNGVTVLWKGEDSPALAGVPTSRKPTPRSVVKSFWRGEDSPTLGTLGNEVYKRGGTLAITLLGSGPIFQEANSAKRRDEVLKREGIAADTL